MISNQKSFWQEFILGPIPTTQIYEHSKVPIGNIDDSVYVKYSYFESVNRVLTVVNKSTSVLLESSTFYSCTHNEKSGAFLLNLKSTANFGLAKCCFIQCTALSSGVGYVQVETNLQSASLEQCVNVEANLKNQRDTMYFYSGVQKVRYYNSSKNSLYQNCQFTAVNTQHCNIDFCIAADNNINDIVIFTAGSSAVIYKCQICNNIQSSAGWSIIASQTSTIIAIGCNFINNRKRLFGAAKDTTGSSVIEYSHCFIDQNDDIGDGLNVDDHNEYENALNIVIVGQRMCNIKAEFSCQKNIKENAIVFLSFALAVCKCFLI